MKSLGIDIGSSSVKVSLMDIPSGSCVAMATNPVVEMPIEALRTGWAEQLPTRQPKGHSGWRLIRFSVWPWITSKF